MAKFTATTAGDEVVEAFTERVKGRACTGTFSNHHQFAFIYAVTDRDFQSSSQAASPGSLGAETAFSLARRGYPAQLILLGRDETKASPALAEIKKLEPSVETHFVPLDLSDKSSVRATAKAILSNPDVKNIDVVINNAGIMACPYTAVKHWKDKQGRPLEMQFATNHVRHFLLINLLLGKIRSSAPGARIVNV